MVWLAETGNAALLGQMLPLVSPQRRKRAERQPPLQAQAGVLGELLLRCAAAEHGLPWDLSLQTGEHGKPCAPDYPDFCFSVAHTVHGGKGCAVLAVADTPVGVDVELLRTPPLRVAERCFTAEEQAWLQQDPALRFWVLWTCKEAVVKQHGEGFSARPFASFSVLEDPRLQTVQQGEYLISCCGGASLRPLCTLSAEAVLEKARQQAKLPFEK